MTQPNQPGLYIAITERIVAIVKIIGKKPYLEINKGINLTSLWNKDDISILTDVEMAHIKSCLMNNKLLLIPVLDTFMANTFQASSIPPTTIEFNDEDTSRWIDLYKTMKKTGVSTIELIKSIMFDGNYTLTQAKMIYQYLERKINSKC